MYSDQIAFTSIQIRHQWLGLLCGSFVNYIVMQVWWFLLKPFFEIFEEPIFKMATAAKLMAMMPPCLRKLSSGIKNNLPRVCVYVFLCFLTSGLFFILPCTDSYTKVDLRTVSFDVPPQEVAILSSIVFSSHYFTISITCGFLFISQSLTF